MRRNSIDVKGFTEGLVWRGLDALARLGCFGRSRSTERSQGRQRYPSVRVARRVGGGAALACLAVCLCGVVV